MIISLRTIAYIIIAIGLFVHLVLRYKKNISIALSSVTLLIKVVSSFAQSLKFW